MNGKAEVQVLGATIVGRAVIDGCRDGEMMMIGSIPTRFSTLQHRHPTDVPRHGHQRPLSAHGL
ncbi:MAG: hypothetical protein M3495_09870, partial [Pseudomonadota bacterium]|nr:hypothetical protein [Pseudomonadota bacterium]